MKNLLLILLFSLPAQVSAMCTPVDTLVIGDSQTGSSWATSYLGNFLPKCLQGSFAFYGRGGTVPGHWMTLTNMDHIETVYRTNENHNQKLGPASGLKDCQKRIGPMLDSHLPRTVIFQFGGNMIWQQEAESIKQINQLMNEIKNRNLSCYFITPTYEMAVTERRNVPGRNITSVKKINALIKEAIGDRCQIIDGVEIMKESEYFDGKELLKRIQIPGLNGCSGAAENDNVHVCGAAAKDWAQRVCKVLYSDSY